LKDNFRYNRFWFWKALETYGIGGMFIIRQNTISFYPPRPSLLMYFDDPPFIFLLGIVGTFTLVYALWDINNLAYKSIMTGLLTFVWLLFFIVFMLWDLEQGVVIGFESMYAAFVLASIINEIVVRG